MARGLGPGKANHFPLSMLLGSRRIRARPLSPSTLFMLESRFTPMPHLYSSNACEKNILVSYMALSMITIVIVNLFLNSGLKIISFYSQKYYFLSHTILKKKSIILRKILLLSPFTGEEIEA